MITSRLVVPRSHAPTILQTVKWLDYHDIPYGDLCFMEEKGHVGADLYVEDGPDNIQRLRGAHKQVIVFDNSTNRHIACGPKCERAVGWAKAEPMIRRYYYEWLEKQEHRKPPKPGQPPPDDASPSD